MLLTNADINLINRVARYLRAGAFDIADVYSDNWTSDANAKKAKRDFDRLQRDERDLIMLRKRLEKGE